MVSWFPWKSTVRKESLKRATRIYIEWIVKKEEETTKDSAFTLLEVPFYLLFEEKKILVAKVPIFGDTFPFSKTEMP